MNTSIIIVAVLGIFILASNFYHFSGSDTDWTTHPQWLGVKPQTATGISILLLLAAIGFIRLVWWAFMQDGTTNISQGILSNFSGNLFNYLIFTFLVSSLLWSWILDFASDSENSMYHWFVCILLWICALSVLLIIVGLYQYDETPPSVMLGTLALGTVVCLNDIGWSARYIQKHL
tara:strand:+ start:1630 stop:2157 length:528 start_codon:yes stop_codon:yes gene_type:complete